MIKLIPEQDPYTLMNKTLSQGKGATWLLLREDNQRDSYTDSAILWGFQQILNLM